MAQGLSDSFSSTSISISTIQSPVQLSESDAAPTKMKNLLACPNELLHHIFRYVDPVDIAHLSLSCRALNENIASDGHLYRSVYFRILDVPPENMLEKIDYEAKMKELVRFRNVLNSSNSADEVRETMSHEILFVSNYVTHLLRNASSEGQSKNVALLTNSTFPPSATRNALTNLEALNSQSQTYHRALRQSRLLNPDPADLTLKSLDVRQASAKLHVLCGKPILNARIHFTQPYPYAMSMVYDLRNYTEESMWGPYMNDGQATADWEKLEAIMLVLGSNVEGFRKTVGDKMMPRGLVWTVAWKGASPYSYESKAILGLDHAGEEEGEVKILDVDVETDELVIDPYNVTGTWQRVVCFLDFHDLFAYNFTPPPLPAGVPRPPIETTEAIRLLSMEIRATHSEPPGPNDGQSHPVVHFEGVSRSLHSAWDPNADSNIRGSVRMTKEGEVRWQTISVYQGEERWRSEGIQIGGIQSARGVLGHWFEKDHDMHGPAGPTAFYKLSDQIKRRVSAEEDSDFFEGTPEVDAEDPESDSEAGDESSQQPGLYDVDIELAIIEGGIPVHPQQPYDLVAGELLVDEDVDEDDIETDLS